jgi:hypothetical protein
MRFIHHLPPTADPSLMSWTSPNASLATYLTSASGSGLLILSPEPFREAAASSSDTGALRFVLQLRVRGSVAAQVRIARMQDTQTSLA